MAEDTEVSDDYQADPIMGAMVEAAAVGIKGFQTSVDYTDLAAIVRGLAANDPILSVGGNEEADYVCSLCPEEWYEQQQPYYQRHEDVEHSPQCVWLRATEWASAHPVSGDQP